MDMYCGLRPTMLLQRLLKVTLGLIICLGFGMCSHAQTNISGVINIYTSISSVNPGANTVTVGSTAGFAVGDTVLLIQMKGATMDLTNTATFGNITAANNAGKYEFAIICNIAGNIVTFDQQLINTYSATGAAQMISVPNYTDANVNATLNATDWNGSTGGVVVVWVSGTLSLGANIDVTTNGFRGGGPQQIVYSCACFGGPVNSAYFYPAASSQQGSFKGEGIAALTLNYESGKGKQVNGGGGGNDHNAGGGGGSNYGAGGIGSRTQACAGGGCTGQHAGIGGLTLNTYYTGAENRIFLGGGGGAGNFADNSAQPACAGANTCPTGGEGAGIVIIHAGTMDGNGFSILANGQSVTSVGQGNGLGGGGGGGAILLDVAAFTSDALTLNVAGGNGGNHSWFSTGTNCKGPGGGGGGGAIWHSGASLPGTVFTNVAGGTRGAQTGAGCVAGGGDNAVAGSAGSTVASLAVPFSATDYVSCNLGPLPVNFLSFTGYQKQNAVELTWSTASESGAAYYEVQRSINGSSFEVLGIIEANGTTQHLSEYSFTDVVPFRGAQYYRLHQVDENGGGLFTNVIEITFNPGSKLIGNVYPNPAKEGQSLFVNILGSEIGEIRYELTDAFGKVILTASPDLSANGSRFEILLPAIPSGVYFLRVSSGSLSEVSRVFVASHD
jgi:Secretion system C-terminal sorting domain